ncbi:DUF805 domain-containing protein [Euryarchaeota archaeon]|jgi:uncharacterized membrane protein YhaH (DUF805 family)|nr:DUF805 domain-containing protein [Euryarchaeota archaeon]MDC0851860.1 DUF805 domain-containing protein [Euryarchaeota archaeon]MDC1029295.1 DUF805 domain-containing protein [Euryarchaeota archaeon]MDC3281841.1 DUF805 domain-containing protein [Euryarchaeota archaeon]
MMEENQMGRPANTMPFMDAMKSGLSNSFNKSGRASRSEYWFWVLGGVIFQITMIVGAVILGVMDIPVLPGLMMIAPILLVPGSITLVVRRLHDVGMSGWMFFVALIPFLGAIYLIYLFVQEGDMEENMYGSVPTNMLE